ncbi:MAG TPA: 1,4-alpha-glucan branching protein domain-containing protein, partial [Nitrospiria bacterium]|nr:1,4-alpha-glucan branching protein domain-containing protein [Nitrospiria bacterium]
MITKGYLCFVFHGHLPYVRHPEHDYFLEENWFYEALTDTYLPLLGVWEGLVRDAIPFRLTVSLSPTLINMMADPLLAGRYSRHLDRLIELAEKELDRTRYESEFHAVARMYHERFRGIRERYRGYRGDLIGAFRRLEEHGVLEIMTSAATHGYLPLLSPQWASVQTQIRVGVETFTHFMGHPPKGLWLPECGYFPGLDECLREAGLRYCLLETHGLVHAQPRPKYGVYAPVYCPSGLAAFGRDPESSKQVWSADEGYPGDIDYREYYRDIGFDLDYDYIRPYIHPDGIRINTGIKYYRITGKTDHKQVYVRSWALGKADAHAGNFLFNREKQIEWLAPQMARPPIVVAPYDLELFGHWWFEGPEWLDLLIRKLVCDQESVGLITPSDYLDHHPVNQVTTPSASSWGHKGYNEVWLNGRNDWVWRHLHQAAQRMEQLVRDHPSVDGLKHRALNQALRELLQAQSSDWPFMMKT